MTEFDTSKLTDSDRLRLFMKEKEEQENARAREHEIGMELLRSQHQEKEDASATARRQVEYAAVQAGISALVALVGQTLDAYIQVKNHPRTTRVTYEEVIPTEK